MRTGNCSHPTLLNLGCPNSNQIACAANPKCGLAYAPMHVYSSVTRSGRSFQERLLTTPRRVDWRHFAPVAGLPPAHLLRWKASPWWILNNSWDR